MTAAPSMVLGKDHSLNLLATLLSDDMAEVNHVILTHMNSSVDLIPKLAGHLIESGGKRIRPLLTLAGARLSGYTGPSAPRLAACVEFIHTATLLHDDVVDESTRRRGNLSAHTIWGNSAAVLVGDFLFSRSFQLMVEEKSLDVLRILANASATIAEGEVMQLLTARNLETCTDDYIRVVEHKTAALFQASCEIGPTLAASPAPYRTALKTFGHALGIAFQLVDDVLDYTADTMAWGKNIGDDLREGKITYPVSYAYHQGNPSEKSFWRHLFAEGNTAVDLDEVKSLLNKHNALGYTLDQATSYGIRAKNALNIFDDSPLKNALMGATHFVLTREG